MIVVHDLLQRSYAGGEQASPCEGFRTVNIKTNTGRFALSCLMLLGGLVDMGFA